MKVIQVILMIVLAFIISTAQYFLTGLPGYVVFLPIYLVIYSIRSLFPWPKGGYL